MLHKHVKLIERDVIEGKGLVAEAVIYAGEVVSRLEPNQPMYAIEEVQQWGLEAQETLLHYAYQCNETHLVSEQGDERYMNHSCDPNTWWADDNTMIARRDIHPGEELTYDYATTELAIPFSMTCRCGSPHCRGVITHTDYQIAEWQARFGAHLPQHTRKAIKIYQQSLGG